MRMKKSEKIESKRWIIGVILVLLGIAITAIVGFFPDLFKGKSPQFIIEKQFLKSDAPIIIKANNKQADRSEPLDIEFDEYVFYKQGIPQENKAGDKQSWEFVLKDQKPPPAFFDEGTHRIKAGFPGEDRVDVQPIFFADTSPIVRAEHVATGDDESIRTIKGIATTESQHPKNVLKVDIIYFHEGKEQSMDVPVIQKKHPEKGFIYYEFETEIQGLPRFQRDDPRYEERFFEIRITDQAGNRYYQEQSYAQYMVPGKNSFGVRDIADISVKKSEDEEDGRFINIGTVTPTPQRIDKLEDGKPPIILIVTGITKNVRRLKWKSLVKNRKPFTLVFREQKQIGNSLKNEYIDNDVLDKKEVIYHLEQEGLDNKRYISNTETYIAPGSGTDTAIITIRSNVKDDIVFIDDKEYGSTKIEAELPKGTHVVRVEKPGYTQFEEEIELAENTTIRAELEPNLTLRVKTEPPGATVFTDGKLQGVSPITIEGLKPGKLKIKVELGGYIGLEIEKEIEEIVESGEQQLAILELKPIGEIENSFTNTIGMTFVYIPPGEFLMGTPKGEKGRYNDEIQHPVKLTKGFYLQITEVTQGQWKAVMGSNPSRFENCGDECPVESVSWNNAQEFMGKLNKLEGGKSYRLPTEAEWEYACRAGSKERYSFGDDENSLGDYAWYYINSDLKTHPAGLKKPNALGIYDMHGNVREWCNDWVGDYPSKISVDPVGPGSGNSRVLRGGSWSGSSDDCRCAVRYYYRPFNRLNLVGFRCARIKL